MIQIFIISILIFIPHVQTKIPVDIIFASADVGIPRYGLDLSIGSLLMAIQDLQETFPQFNETFQIS